MLKKIWVWIALIPAAAVAAFIFGVNAWLNASTAEYIMKPDSVPQAEAIPGG